MDLETGLNQYRRTVPAAPSDGRRFNDSELQRIQKHLSTSNAATKQPD